MNAEKAFSRYLETFEVDGFYSDFFSVLHKAYIAGYEAAGGDISDPQPVFQIAPLLRGAPLQGTVCGKAVKKKKSICREEKSSSK